MSFKKIKVTNKSAHQEVWNLLPWYINHSLDPSEQDVVKNHTKTCITCRIEINKQQQLFEKIQQTDLLQQTSQVSFAQLKKQIKGQPQTNVMAEHEKTKKDQKIQSHQRFDFVKYSPLAASLLLLATSFVLQSPIDKPELEGEYTTLANPTKGKYNHNMIRIVFAEHSQSDQIETILSSVSGQIIKGPSRNDIYDVQIGNKQTNSQEVINAISQLRKNSLVVFAEPAHGLPSSD